MSNGQKSPKRSLVLAGGGMKVAFQAGVLQVWLDEAGLKFEHVDGASGGVFNLAMMCQGMSGQQIADAWRRTDPVAAADVNAAELAKLFWAKSLLTLDALKTNLFGTWGLDFAKVSASQLNASFNVYNFSEHRLEVWPPAGMTADRLSACVALPMWFPPVELNGSTYIDAVYITDGNVEEAIARGADEIWVVWTVSEKGEWEDGFVANYFQIIETVANGNFRRILARVDANNAAIKAGRSGEFGRHISLKVLRAEVPLHYLIGFSKDRLHEAVNLGVQRAREWCNAEGVPLNRSTGDFPLDVHDAQTTLEFTEVMRGYANPGDTDFEQGYLAGKKNEHRLTFEVTIHVDGVNRFVVNPQHEATITGWVDADFLGGRRTIHEGAFNLLVDSVDPKQKAMYYRLFFVDNQGQPRTLVGFKSVKDDAGADVWEDTTTLYVRILNRHLSQSEDSGANITAAGIMKISWEDFVKELASFEVTGPTLADRSAARSRFAKLFVGKLWDVYLSHILTYSPL